MRIVKDHRRGYRSSRRDMTPRTRVVRSSRASADRNVRTFVPSTTVAPSIEEGVQREADRAVVGKPASANRGRLDVDILIEGAGIRSPAQGGRASGCPPPGRRRWQRLPAESLSRRPEGSRGSGRVRPHAGGAAPHKESRRIWPLTALASSEHRKSAVRATSPVRRSVSSGSSRRDSRRFRITVGAMAFARTPASRSSSATAR